MTFLSIAQDLIIMKPLVLWAKSVFLTGIISKDVHGIMELLQTRAKLVMLRTTGLMKNANARIQHVSYTYPSLIYHLAI